MDLEKIYIVEGDLPVDFVQTGNAAESDRSVSPLGDWGGVRVGSLLGDWDGVRVGSLLAAFTESILILLQAILQFLGRAWAQAYIQNARVGLFGKLKRKTGPWGGLLT
jgi:hypothetical protein